MKTNTGFFIRLSIIMCILSIAWLGYNTYMYRDFASFVMRGDVFMWISVYGLLLFFVSHLIVIFSAVNSFRNSVTLSATEIILVIFCIFSFVVLMVQFIVMNEIEDEIRAGYPYKGLINVIWISQVVMIAFFLYALFYFVRLYRLSDEMRSPKSVSREQLFVAFNMIGIACSLWGILFIFFQYTQFRHIQLELHMNRYIRPFGLMPYLFVLLPYIFVFTAWLILYIRDRKKGWFDEKQNRDIHASGMATLLVSLPFIVIPVIYCFLNMHKVFFHANFAGTITVLWMMLYLFIVLLSFSSFSIYNYRRN